MLTKPVYFLDILLAYLYKCGSLAGQELVLPAMPEEVPCPVSGRENKLIKSARGVFAAGLLL